MENIRRAEPSHSLLRNFHVKREVNMCSSDDNSVDGDASQCSVLPSMAMMMVMPAGALYSLLCNKLAFSVPFLCVIHSARRLPWILMQSLQQSS